jgi:hypothetical protein
MKSPGAMARASGLAAVIALGSGAQALFSQGLAPQHLDDNSDWWSTANAVPAAQGATPQKRNISDKNFEVMSVALGEDMFSQAGTEFGSVRPVIRGETSNFREQACYAFPAHVFLIFEHTEVGDSFYLFTGAAQWKGEDACVPVARPPSSVATGSGLHIGQTPEQVVAILGPPGERTPEQLFYVLGSKRPATAEDVAALGKQHPPQGDTKPPKTVEFDVTVTIVAKFARGELNYLAVSKAESIKPETRKQ